MGRLELRLILGWYPNQKGGASYVSECVIAAGRKKLGAAIVRLGRTKPSTRRARNASAFIPLQGNGGKGSGDARLRPFAAKFQQFVSLVLFLRPSGAFVLSRVSSFRITTESFFSDQ